MLTTQQAYQVELKKLIEEYIVKLNDQIINGNGITDYSQYRYYVGKLVGLATALELCSEANEEVARKYR